MRAVNDLYRHYYPLLQRAYEDLGYPQRVSMIGCWPSSIIYSRLRTRAGPLALVRPKVFWEFADPDLEARSAGQKLLLRLGSTNAAVVERKLRELRSLVAASPPQR